MVKKILAVALALSVVLLGVYVGLLDHAVFTKYVMPAIIGYLALTVYKALWFSAGGITSRDKVRKYDKDYPDAFRPHVSIIVPAHNEELVIESTLQSLSKLNYMNFEVIVVDDGSTDDTAKIVKRVQRQSSISIRLIKKKNGGKASALNTGIENAEHDFIMCIDADSVVHPDSLKYGIRHFADPKIAAVGGFVEIDPTNALISKFQEFEYTVGLNFVRRAIANYNVMPVIAGPSGIFRKEVLLDIGGYSENHFAEDADLTLRLASNGYKIESEEKMISYTQAPNNNKDLLKQRYRWNRGMFSAINSNLRGLLDKKPSFRNMMLYLVFETYISMIVNIVLMVSFITQFINTGSVTGLSYLIVTAIISELFVIMTAMIGKKNKLKWVAVGILSQLTYNVQLVLWRFRCLFDHICDTKMNWNKVDRREVVSE